MPRVGYSEEYGSGGSEKFPRLKLVKDERVRIVCVESPWSEWTHELRGPEIQNGHATIQVNKRRDNTEYETFKMQYIGNPICLGIGATLAEKGVDGDNCPACAASLQSPAVPGPKRRYAMNVIRYRINNGPDFAVAQPFSADIIVWAFSAKMFDKLLGFQREWKSLRDHDLLLGPCEDAFFQRYETRVAQTAAWQGSEQIQDWIGKLWTGPGNRATDEQLRDACGRTSPRGFMEGDVRRVLQLTAMAEAAGTAPDPGQFAGQPQPGLQQGFGDLLGGAPSPVHPLAQQAAAQQAQPADPFGGQGFGQQAPQPAAAQAQPSSQDLFAAPQPAQQFAPQQFAPQQAQAFPQGVTQGFAPQPAQQFAPQPAQQFAPQPAQQFAPQPQAQPQQDGMAEFAPGTTMNPVQTGTPFQPQQAPAPAQQFAPQAPAPAQPGAPFAPGSPAPAPAPATAGPAFPSSPAPQGTPAPLPQADGAPSFDQLLAMGQGGQPQQ